MCIVEEEDLEGCRNYTNDIDDYLLVSPLSSRYKEEVCCAAGRSYLFCAKVQVEGSAKCHYFPFLMLFLLGVMLTVYG